MNSFLFFILAILSLLKILVLTAGCAQIISPTGGVRDSLPPTLLAANPAIGTTNFTGKRIIINFDEYVEINELRENLLVSPTPKNDPYVDYKLKTVTIKMRDTLDPNTTYSINLGNAIRDINEGNIYKNFTYVFSTGSIIDSLELSGKVQLAETGKTDSTLLVFLYNNRNDSAVQTLKPRYIAKLDSGGNFTFRNLAPDIYNVFALKDGDGGKTYNSKVETFAFADSPVNIIADNGPLKLYAYAEEKEKVRVPRSTATAEKTLKYTTNITSEKQDILEDLVIVFNKPLKNFDPQKILLTDTLNVIIKEALMSIDSTGKKVMVKNKWLPDSNYNIIILKDAVSDSTGLELAESDTIRFQTNREADYGSIKINFLNFDNSKNPVLQFVKSNEVVKAYPLTTANWSVPLFEPGDYELRILFDENNNGFWNPGSYEKKLQPEKVYLIPQTLNVKANWENERDIEFPVYKLL
jgi:hypothetical protein